MIRRRKRSRGFTLIELMIVVSILGILSTLAIGFSGTWRRRQVFRRLARETFNVLNISRAEALRRGTKVDIQFDNTTGNIYAFIDANANRSYASGEGDTLIYQYPEPGASGMLENVDIYDADMTITLHDPSDTSCSTDLGGTVLFDHQGFSIDASFDPVEYLLCVSDADLGDTVYVDVSVAGAVRIQDS